MRASEKPAAVFLWMKVCCLRAQPVNSQAANFFAMNPPVSEIGAEEAWKQPVDRLLARPVTTAAGLGGAEAQPRLETFGPNDAAVVKRSPLWLQFLSRFRPPSSSRSLSAQSQRKQKGRFPVKCRPIRRTKSTLATW
jgi:hypothetical protein